jgi:hypothetical protein
MTRDLRRCESRDYKEARKLSDVEGGNLVKIQIAERGLGFMKKINSSLLAEICIANLRRI